MSFIKTVILAKQFIVCNKKKCPQKVSTKSIHKKWPQEVATKSVYNMSPNNISKKGVVKKCSKNFPRQCLWKVSMTGDSMWKVREKHNRFFLDFWLEKSKVFVILVTKIPFLIFFVNFDHFFDFFRKYPILLNGMLMMIFFIFFSVLGLLRNT